MSISVLNKFSSITVRLLTYLLFVLILSGAAYAASAPLSDSEQSVSKQSISEQSNPESEAQVIQKFTSQEVFESDIITIEDQTKRQVMFAMGVPLLLFIIITVSLGIAMGVFGKDVYLAHMIFAGLSLTLALGHATVGLVWFWPF